MNKDSRQTAPTQYVEANGIRFAYRRFGVTVTAYQSYGDSLPNPPRNSMRMGVS